MEGYSRYLTKVLHSYLNSCHWIGLNDISNALAATPSKMRISSILLLFALSAFSSDSLQSQYSIFSDIHPLDSSKAHYLELSRLSGTANENDPLDEIAFPPEKYSTYALMFTLAEPAYLTKSQIQKMVSELSYTLSTRKRSGSASNHRLAFFCQWTYPVGLYPCFYF